jgi:hypothetical protein
MKKYGLQKKVYQGKNKSSFIWKNTNTHSDDLMTLKSLCPNGFRIVNKKSGIVVHEPE